MTLDKKVKVSMIQEKIDIIDNAVSTVQENINGNYQGKEGAMSFEQQLTDLISKKQALLKMKQLVEEEIQQ